MIIVDLNHLETVAATPDVVGGSYGFLSGTSINFSVSNYADVNQWANSYSSGGKATSGIGNTSASSTSVAYNTSTVEQANLVYGIAIDP